MICSIRHPYRQTVHIAKGLLDVSIPLGRSIRAVRPPCAPPQVLKNGTEGIEPIRAPYLHSRDRDQSIGRSILAAPKIEMPDLPSLSSGVVFWNGVKHKVRPHNRAEPGDLDTGVVVYKAKRLPRKTFYAPPPEVKKPTKVLGPGHYEKPTYFVDLTDDPQAYDIPY